MAIPRVIASLMRTGRHVRAGAEVGRKGGANAKHFKKMGKDAPADERFGFSMGRASRAASTMSRRSLGRNAADATIGQKGKAAYEGAKAAGRSVKKDFKEAFPEQAKFLSENKGKFAAAGAAGAGAAAYGKGRRDSKRHIMRGIR